MLQIFSRSSNDISFLLVMLFLRFIQEKEWRKNSAMYFSFMKTENEKATHQRFRSYSWFPLFELDLLSIVIIVSYDQFVCTKRVNIF